jgi:dynein light intermediate chain 2
MFRSFPLLPPRTADPGTTATHAIIPPGTLNETTLECERRRRENARDPDAQADVPKATEGMEYNYARKTHATNIERKDVAHIWEISGTRQFADEATEQENIFMGMRQITTAVVLIVLDLSKPHDVLPTLEYWLSRVRARTDSTFGKLEKRGSKLPEQLRSRSKRVFGAAHEDAKEVGVIAHSGVTVVIAATKYDAFKNADAELKKVMSRTLRFLAHSNSAGLFYLGGLRGGVKSSPADAVAVGGGCTS